MAETTVIGHRCRTSDRSAGHGRGADALARLLAQRLGTEPRMVGMPGEGRTQDWAEDLRDSRGCILEAGGQVEDALGAGQRPVLCAGDCTVSLTTLPTVARLHPDVRILWIDAHGDFNTPATTSSGFLGGMCLAAACGRWDAGFEGGVDPANVLLVGARDLDGPEVAELDFAGVTRLERFGQIADAVDGHELYVHLDLDVLDPALFPAVFAAKGGLTDAGLKRLLDEVTQAAGSLVGFEVTCFEAPEDEAERDRLGGLAADAILPALR